VDHYERSSIEERDIWLQPLTLVLSVSNEKFHRNLGAYVMQPLLKKHPYIFQDFLAIATETNSELELLITILNYGRKLGLITSYDDLFKLVPWTRIHQALFHDYEHLRITTISMLVDNPKPSSLITEFELRYFLLFLKLNIRSPHTEFRHRLIALFDRMIQRLKSYQDHQSYRGFLDVLMVFLLGNLHPGANYQRTYNTSNAGNHASGICLDRL
jgi:hypothetical protein